MPFTITHWMIWVALFALFALIELLTSQLVSIWFAIGSLVAAIVALVMNGSNLTTEIIVFAIVSVLVLLCTRPLVRKIMDKKPVPTNKDALIGAEGIVTVYIDNADETGEVRVKGNEWTARAEDGFSPIGFGTPVQILRIDGVKLIVKPIQKVTD